MRGHNRIITLIITGLLVCGTLTAQGTKYEAESATLTGSVQVLNSLAGYSGTGYVGQFENEGDRVTFNFNIVQEGNYDIYIGNSSPYGQKINIVSVNGNSTEVTFTQSSGFKETLFGKIHLASGSNSLYILKSWGWFLVDYIRVVPNNDPEIAVTVPYLLATPDPSTETERLFSYLSDRFTYKIHSGVMNLYSTEEAEWLHTLTGKYPALLGLDFMNHTRNYGWYDKSLVMNSAKSWYGQNGLVAFCWHWRDPSRNTEEFYTSNTNFDISKISDPTSAEYAAMVSDIDIIAGYLKQLDKAKVPVLFRPLHEASGGWFWWGAKGPEPCKKLWRLMFDRLVYYHGLKNLIWVWTTDTRADNLDWYPGDNYVDILGADIYTANGDYSSQVLSYNAIKDRFKGRKIITLSENGPVPNPDNLVGDKASWSWFMPWYGDFVRNPEINPAANWQEIMNHDYVITRDEMPDLKSYPVREITSYNETPQAFFLNNWRPKIIEYPEYEDIQQVTDPVNVAVTIDFTDTLTKVPGYLFGDNANLWTGCMSDNKGLMKNIASRNIGVLRGPGGSTSDVFFWNRSSSQFPDSVPASLPGSTATDWPWYGKRPNPWETWTMDVDSFYSVLGKVNATGMITVNYGYARYGTAYHPVNKAAHMAAEWVRYDNGRSKFWEIGNEVFGSWEAGYRIDVFQNRDGQPQFITPELYGRHCRIFIDSMKAAAAEIGVNIKVGVVMLEAYSSSYPTWNKSVAEQVGDKADFYVVHSYYTPYNENSTVETILNSYTKTGTYKSYVWSEVAKANKPGRPVAMTEYNIFATGSKQAVSHVNGMHAVLVTGEAMKTDLGAALRWDLANGWDNGNDHGMFSYNEPGITNYAPHPAFYHMYYLQRFTGDVLLNSTQTGAQGLVIIPTAFSSGQVAAAIVNTSRLQRVMRLNVRNFRFGARYYAYTLTGNAGEDFSRKVFINGLTTTLEAGGPEDYEDIKAGSGTFSDEIRIKIPPLSSVFVLVEPGTRELTINNEVTSTGDNVPDDNILICPNPAHDVFTIRNIPADTQVIEIRNMSGELLWVKKQNISLPDETISIRLAPGVYFINISGDNTITKKLIVN